MFKKQVSLSERILLKDSMSHSSLAGIVRLAIKVLIYSFTLEGMAASIYAVRWAQEMEPGQAIYFAIFHAISIFNNAGFVVLGDFMPYVNDYIINIVSIILILFGGIGFIVISDLLEFPRSRRLSLHTKIILTATLALTMISTIMIYVLEYSNGQSLGSLNQGGKWLASFFQAVSLRSAGINTLDISGLREATQFMMIIMMFIGAAPGSTGGGIKLTTFVVLVGSVKAMIRGKEEVILFRHRVPHEDVYKAISVTILAVFVVVSATMLLTVMQSGEFLMMLFEAASAFGTVGLSMGLTPELTGTSKILIIVLMFTGRIGILTLAFAFLPKHKKELYRYPEGRITIG